VSPPAIRLDDVHVAYEHGRRPALRGLDLEVPAGRTVALVGETGAGKSTVASLLLRFLESDAGAVTVDGVPLASIGVDAWRRSVAWVPQAPYLFAGTVAENVRLASPGATDADVEAAARDAGAHEFVSALPQGYATPLGEDGARLSGGEQQRIALARAFLRDAPFVILDEVTSHLDPVSEGAIVSAVERLARRRTVLVISHRLRLAALADTVVVLAGGRAVEAGPPAQLLARDGPYRRLVAIEAEGGS
jgi:ATP-binding cassette subfamily C protein CydD